MVTFRRSDGSPPCGTPDAALARRYERFAPRYASYPRPEDFTPGFGPRAYTSVANKRRASHAHAPLALYMHLPFCAHVCFYCAFSKIVSASRDRAKPYLSRLYRELELQGAAFPASREVRHLHWGGGTPTFLTDRQLAAVMDATRSHFTLSEDDDREFTIEVDPRETHPESMSVLHDLGFNRLSVGIQDLDPRVQIAVNRLQMEARSFAVIELARQAGFRSVNVDLMYGLPFQTRDSFRHTVGRVLLIEPDRISLHHYEHRPGRIEIQRRIASDDLPEASERLALIASTTEQLLGAGYLQVGTDHFAKPGDTLATAKRDGSLRRDGHGYTSRGDADLVGMGATAVGAVGNCYYQNFDELGDYYAALDEGRLPIARGMTLTAEDRARREIIAQLLCRFEVDLDLVEDLHAIDLGTRFDDELGELARLEDDGLVRMVGRRIEVLPRGRMLVRSICSVFDEYLRRSCARQAVQPHA